MLGMATTLVCSSRQAAALTTGVLIGAGIVLYQMTSLVLAPASNHQIPLSLRTGGHQAALAAGSSAGLTHDVGYPLSYLRATAGPAERPVAHAAALGMRVAIAGKLGDDDAGGQASQQLRALGIDLRWLRRAPGLRTTIWHEPPEHPESRRLERGADQALRLDELPSPTLAGARLTVASGFSLSVEPARSAAVWALETAERRRGRSALLLDAERLWSTNARGARRVLE